MSLPIETTGPHNESLIPNQAAIITPYPSNYVNPSDVLTVYDNFELIRRNRTMKKFEYFGSIAPSTTDPSLPLFSQLGGTYPVISTGQRIPMNVQTNNPHLIIPTNVNQMFYGASQIYKVAMDQPFAKKIAKFYDPNNGAAASAHDFATNPNYQTGTQNIASVTGYLLHGAQFAQAAGATELIAGGLNSVISIAIQNIIKNGIANNTQTQMPEVSNFISILGNIVGIDFSAIINAITVIVVAGPDPLKNTNSTQLQSLISQAMTTSIGNQPLSAIAPIANQLAGSVDFPIGTLQKIASLGNVLGAQKPNPDPLTVQNQPQIQNTLSKALSNLSFTQFLENNVRQAITQIVPNASQVIFHTLDTATNIAQSTGGSITQSLTPTQPSSMIDYMVGAAKAFSGMTSSPFSADIFNNGVKMSQDVLTYINNQNPP